MILYHIQKDLLHIYLKPYLDIGFHILQLQPEIELWSSVWSAIQPIQWPVDICNAIASIPHHLTHFFNWIITVHLSYLTSTHPHTHTYTEAIVLLLTAGFDLVESVTSSYNFYSHRSTHVTVHLHQLLLYITNLLIQITSTTVSQASNVAVHN